MIKYQVQKAIVAMASMFQVDPELSAVCDKHAALVGAAKKEVRATKISKRVTLGVLAMKHEQERKLLREKHNEERLLAVETADMKISQAKSSLVEARENRKAELATAKHELALRRLRELSGEVNAMVPA